MVLSWPQKSISCDENMPGINSLFYDWLDKESSQREIENKKLKNCWDNDIAKNFFSTIKTKLIYQ
jgi:hypothetical protein